MHVITGGAGFIGSNIAGSLDDCGEDIVIVDEFGNNDLKWRNVAKRRVRDIITPSELSGFLHNRSGVESIIHMGAVSATTESDVDLIVRSNFRLSVDLWNWCTENSVQLIYASSAATYGDGKLGFGDDTDEESLCALRPMNAYGWSKHAFDRWVHGEQRAGRTCPPKWAGLKFFNVYGPNEYHKGGQRSVALQLFEQIRADGNAHLFRSENPDYKDGGQMRDFVWVEDCVQIALWLLNSRAPCSIYNVGSGTARTFEEMARTVFKVMQMRANIIYVDLPEKLRSRYQYYTRATLTKLRDAGYESPTTSLEDGLERYVKDYLLSADIFR